MSDLRDLYQEVILDHGRRPRNYEHLEGATHSAEGFNPLCGDRVKLFLEVEGDVIRRAAFEGSGCAISTASASLLTERLAGRTIGEAAEVFGAFRDMLTAEAAPESAAVEKLGKLGVLQGVRDFPIRIKCATLAWHTLQAALEDKDEPVSTE